MATSAQGRSSSSNDPDVSEEAWKRSKDAFVSKSSSKYLDPCQDFANKSIRCMNRNGGDKDMCQDYFEYAFATSLLLSTTRLLYPSMNGEANGYFAMQSLSKMQERMDYTTAEKHLDT